MKSNASDAALRARRAPRYLLRLYVTGMTQRSLEAMSNLRQICDEHLAGRHTIEIVDIYEHALRARTDQIFAVPTLVRVQPLPVRKFIGNLADRAKVLAGLDLPPDGDMDDSEITPAAEN